MWTSQRYEDNGTTVTHQVLGLHTDQAGTQGGNNALSAKDLADGCCGGWVAEHGGTFNSTNNDPFE